MVAEAYGSLLASYAVPGLPESGTTTGIAVCFDTWAGNALPDGPDVEGLIVRVDIVTVLRRELATRHGGCTDVESLETGPWAEVEGATSPWTWLAPTGVKSQFFQVLRQ